MSIRNITFDFLACVALIATTATAADQRAAGPPRVSATSSSLRPETSAVAGTPGTSYVSFDATAFLPQRTYFFGTDNAWTTNEATNDRTSPNGTASTWTFRVPLRLPDGAIVTEFDFWLVDNDPAVAAWAGGSIWRIPLDRSAVDIPQSAIEGYYTSSPDLQRTTVDGFTLTIDNKSFAYEVEIELAGDRSLQSFHAARVGYIDPTGQGTHFLSTPDRFVDTRATAENRGGRSTPFTVDDNWSDLQIAGVPGRDGQVIPLGAKGIIGNITAVSPAGTGLLKVLPVGTDITAGTSTVNFADGRTTANAFHARLDQNGRLRVAYYGSDQVDVLIDVIAYYY